MGLGNGGIGNRGKGVENAGCRGVLKITFLLQPRERVVILRHDVDKAKGNYGKAIEIRGVKITSAKEFCESLRI